MLGDRAGAPFRVQPAPGVQTDVRTDVRGRRHINFNFITGETGFSGCERTHCGFLRAIGQPLQTVRRYSTPGVDPISLAQPELPGSRRARPASRTSAQ